MARITTNTTGTQPVIIIGLTGANLANANVAITVPFVQDLTITNSTGVYSYTTFSDVDMRKRSSAVASRNKRKPVKIKTEPGTSKKSGQKVPIRKIKRERNSDDSSSSSSSDDDDSSSCRLPEQVQNVGSI